MKARDHAHQLTLIDTPTKEEMNLVQQGLEDYNRKQTNGGLDNPGIEINLILRDGKGNVVGGLSASTMMRVMHLDVLWVAEEYRKLGCGKALVLEAEKIGHEKGCLASQTMSFSFQAPGFYQKIGYEVLGIFDGYPYGITEYVLMKRLRPYSQPFIDTVWMCDDGNSGQLSINENPTKEEMEVVHAGLNNHANRHLGDKRKKNPEIGIRFVLKDHKSKVVGGVFAWTTLRIVVVEYLWIEAPYRGVGFGNKLMVAVERVAKEKGCIAGQMSCLSFHAPDFFQKLGYEIYGISNGYPDPMKAYYFIKKFDG